jgi:hypothetical protein
MSPFVPDMWVKGQKNDTDQYSQKKKKSNVPNVAYKTVHPEWDAC